MVNHGMIKGRKRGRKSQRPLVQVKKLVSKECPCHHVTSGNLPSVVLKRRQQKMKSAVISTQRESKSSTSGCYHRNSKAQKQRKFEWSKSIGKEQLTPQSGLLTATLVTGTSQTRRNRIIDENPVRIESFVQYNALFSLLLIFSASLMNLTIASHNLHGFKQCGTYHKNCLENLGGIWMGQEHWLSKQQIPTMTKLGTQFVARSGMENAISSGILIGRPFGGVSIAWSPQIDHHINPISNYRHKRVVGVELIGEEKSFLLICVYMPFYNSSRRAECMTETIDTLSMIETIIEAHPQHEIIIGGDTNCEFNGLSPYDQMWGDLLTKYDLTTCDSFYPSSSFTYHHNSLNHHKWNDHFVVSKSLIASACLSNHHIKDDGDNPSDHLPIIMTLSAKIKTREHEQNPSQFKESLKWEKISSIQRQQFTHRASQLVDSRPVPDLLRHCQFQCQCNNVACQDAIQAEYSFLMNCLKMADSTLPRHKPGLEKDWWTCELTELRNKCRDIQSIWLDQGRPRQGPVCEERLSVRANYKRTLRSAQRAPKQTSWDRLHSSLAEKDTNLFWKSWKSLYNKNKSHLAPVVDGNSSKQSIANSFMDSFKRNCAPNNPDKVASLNENFASAYQKYKDDHHASCDCNSFTISLYDTMDALGAMKSGKCADSDGIMTEHFQNAPVNLLTRLTFLFNCMLKHAFVPQQFHYGLMLPIIKDHQGNHADLSNYRGITISPISSKLFEHVLKLKFCHHLSTSAYQFGFKKNSSTVHALHCLKQTVNYYVNNGSRVFCCFLDASKAFDRVVHTGLFLKLINRKVPLIFLDIIITWYGELLCRVKWGDAYSEWFSVTAGVRQGGVLSPDFYSIYIDDLIKKLKSLLKGCYYLTIFAAALFYADDMAILVPSIKGLTALLNICDEFCCEWDICLNAKKSKILYYGKRFVPTYDVFLNNKKIEWVNEWAYLGVTLKSGPSFNCSVVERVRKFYRCANAIFRIEGHSNDTVMLHLVETHCVPLLTYAIEVIEVANRDERRQLRVAYNSLFRKIFGYRWLESVTALQNFLHRPTWEQLVEKRLSKFLSRVSNHSLANAFNE